MNPHTPIEVPASEAEAVEKQVASKIARAQERGGRNYPSGRSLLALLRLGRYSVAPPKKDEQRNDDSQESPEA